MFLDLFHMLTKDRRRLGLFAAAAFIAASPSQFMAPAMATDLDYAGVSPTSADEGNYLRIGLNKSAVIKLPAAVKDVIVGDSSVVDVVVRNKTTAYLFGRTAAQTNVFFFDAEGREVLHLDLEVTLDSKGLKKLIDRTIPGNKIQVDTTGSNVVLRGTANNAAEAKIALDLAAKVANGDTNIVNAMSIGEGDQVMLKVRVVEVKREVAKKLGVSLDSALKIGTWAWASPRRPPFRARPALWASISRRAISRSTRPSRRWRARVFSAPSPSRPSPRCRASRPCSMPAASSTQVLPVQRPPARAATATARIMAEAADRPSSLTV